MVKRNVKILEQLLLPKQRKSDMICTTPPVSYAASEGAVHQLHQGAAVQGVVSGPHAAVQWSGPRGWGHSAASRSHLPGHTSQHQPVQLGEVQYYVCVSVRQETRAHSCIDGYFFLSQKSESVFSTIYLMSWSGLGQQKNALFPSIADSANLYTDCVAF